jgi:hypothetical protein
LTNNPAAGTDQAPLHTDPYPNTNSPGEIAECSAGNEPFKAAAPAIGNPIGDVGLKTETTTTATTATTATTGTKPKSISKSKAKDHSQ